MLKSTVPPVEFEIAAKTHAGMRRSNNEDAIVINPEHGLAILADGMGGYNAGEVASSIATSVIQVMMEQGLAQFDWNIDLDPGPRLRDLMRSAIRRANRQILQAAGNDPQFKGMGTTVVMTLFYRDKVAVAHVGDSRLYRFRKGKLSLLTRDHSLLQERIDAGLLDEVTARCLPHRNLLTRAVGMSDKLEIEAHTHITACNDVYLLCSDGVSDMLSAQQIATLLAHHGSCPEQACDELIKSANEHGGNDNCSVILVKFDAQAPAQPGFFGRILQRL